MWTALWCVAKQTSERCLIECGNVKYSSHCLTWRHLRCAPRPLGWPWYACPTVIWFSALCCIRILRLQCRQCILFSFPFSFGCTNVAGCFSIHESTSTPMDVPALAFSFQIQNPIWKYRNKRHCSNLSCLLLSLRHVTLPSYTQTASNLFSASEFNTGEKPISCFWFPAIGNKLVDSHPLAKRQKPHYETPCACMEPNRVYPIISPLHACVIRSPRLYHCQRHSSSPVELGGRRGGGAEYIMPPAVDDNVPPNGRSPYLSHFEVLENCGGILFWCAVEWMEATMKMQIGPYRKPCCQQLTLGTFSILAPIRCSHAFPLWRGDLASMLELLGGIKFKLLYFVSDSI